MMKTQNEVTKEYIKITNNVDHEPTIALMIYQMGYLDGANEQKQETAANVFAFIIDHGELIPEEQCMQMCSDFLKDKDYNKIIKPKSD